MVAYVFVATLIRLQSRCLPMNVYSVSATQAFRRHVTILLLKQIFPFHKNTGFPRWSDCVPRTMLAVAQLLIDLLVQWITTKIYDYRAGMNMPFSGIAPLPSWDIIRNFQYPEHIISWRGVRLPMKYRLVRISKETEVAYSRCCSCVQENYEKRHSRQQMPSPLSPTNTSRIPEYSVTTWTTCWVCGSLHTGAQKCKQRQRNPKPNRTSTCLVSESWSSQIRRTWEKKVKNKVLGERGGRIYWSRW
jgi:hypothetical protein